MVSSSTTLTPVNELYVLGLKSNPEWIGYCRGCPLRIWRPLSNLGHVHATFVIGKKFHTQSLFDKELMLTGCVYDYSWRRLVTLHETQRLVISRLELNAAECKLEQEELKTLDVPVGFRLCSRYTVRGNAVLYKHWKMTFDGVEIDKTEMLLVDLLTGAVKRRMLDRNSIKQSIYAKNSLVTLSNGVKTVRLVGVDC